MNVSADLLHDLDSDGATVDLPDGRQLRVRIEPDQDTTINVDYDCYGRMSWVERNRTTGDDRPRPDGFDGRARKLSTSHGDRYWWQPPDGMPSDEIPRFSYVVRDLVEYGFHGVILELLDGADAYGRPIVRDVASVWGVDDVGPEYVRDLVSDLVYELTGPAR